jgi:hypothetical protein
MTPYEAYDLAQSLFSNGISAIAVYLSLTFAYLAAAYFIGKDLSRLQVTTLSTIFLLFSSITAWGAAAYTNAAVQTLVRAGSNLDSFYDAKPWVATLVGASCAVGTVMCLKFMWDVRRSD